MKLKPITQEIADAFSSHMCSRFNARIVRKSTAVEMKIVGALFDIARVFSSTVPSGHQFERFATTIGPMIYLPDGLSPEDTVVIVTHECQHVQQFWKENFGMMWLYLTEGEARVRYEAEAYGADLAVRFALNDNFTLPALDDLALPLEGGYALSPAHIELGRSLLEQQATSVQVGFSTIEAGEEALKWLRSHGVVT